MLSAICFSLNQSKILSFGNGLKLQILWKLPNCLPNNLSLHSLPDNKISDWSKLKQLQTTFQIEFKMENKYHIG